MHLMYLENSFDTRLDILHNKWLYFLLRSIFFKHYKNDISVKSFQHYCKSDIRAKPSWLEDPLLPAVLTDLDANFITIKTLQGRYVQTIWQCEISLLCINKFLEIYQLSKTDSFKCQNYQRCNNQLSLHILNTFLFSLN